MWYCRHLGNCEGLLCAPWTTAPTWPGLVLPMRCSMKREIHRGCHGWKQIRMVKVQQSMCKPVVKYLWISVNVGYLQVGNWFGQFASWGTLWTAWSGVSKRADGYGWLAPNGDSGQIAQWKAANSEAVPQSGHRGSWRNVWKSPTWDMVQFHWNVFIRRSWSGQEPKLIKRSTILCNIWNITNNYVLATGEDDAKGSMSELYQWLNPVKKGSEDWNQEPPHGKPLQVVVTQHIDSDSRGLQKSPRLEALSWGRKDACSLPDVQLPNRCKQSKYQSKFEQEQMLFSICLISHASLELGELRGKDALRWMCPDEFLHHGNPILYGSGVAGVVGKHTGSSIWCTPQQPPEHFLIATRKHRNQLVTIECAEHKNPLMAALTREFPWLYIDSTP